MSLTELTKESDNAAAFSLPQDKALFDLSSGPVFIFSSQSATSGGVQEMQSLRNFLLKSVGLLVVLLTVANFANAQKAPQPVVVTNTVAQPVPTVAQGTTTVAGSVSVANTPSVNVANTPSVDINSMPAVSLGSGATVAIDPSTTVNAADVTARNIVRLYAGVACNSNCSSDYQAKTRSGGSYYVPTGKRLVINSLSIRAELPNTVQPYFFVATGGAFAVFAEMRTVVTSNSSAVYVYNSAAPIYVDASNDIHLGCDVVGDIGGSAWLCGAVFQGYLVDCGTGGCTQQ